MATTGSRAEATARLYVAPVEGAAELFTPAFADYLIRLHDEFATRVRALRDRRAEVLTRALTHGIPPTDPPASEARTGNWRVAPVPDELQRPGIEISGPCSITSMFINALNPGPEGERAEGDLDDDEDSAAHRLVDTVQAARNRLAAVHRELTYVAGLNAARWDLKASIFEYVMADPKAVWPDRFGVDIKTTPFLANIFRRLVAVCLKRGAVPVGGMATALPSHDPEVNRVAAEAIRADKQWEAAQGFLRAWVAHIFHMKTAADPFRTLRASGWKPTAAMADPDTYPVRIEVPAGPITLEGTRRNCRMVIEYLEGWLNGRGAKGIDSLAGKPGIHPALMEDLATGRMSVAQIAQ